MTQAALTLSCIVLTCLILVEMADWKWKGPR